MALLNTKTADSAQDLIDYQVVDQSGEHIGEIHSFWADPESDKLEFIGVKTGWLFGHNHVVPVEKVEIDDANRVARIPYTSEFVKGALSIDAESEITDSEETEIYRYYGVKGQGNHGSVDTATASSFDTNSTRTSSTASTVERAAGTGAVATGAASGVAASSTARTAASGETVEVPLTEEQVNIGKRSVSAGQVRLRKVIRTEVVNQPVELHHEDIVIERVSAADVRGGAAVTDFKEETIEVPLTREEVVVQKEAHVTGAVRLRKTDEVEQQTVSETIRKEDVELDKTGMETTVKRTAMTHTDKV